ncbi:hypothetical protein CEXT_714631 [Caerostris extrusa]|uniref:Uncharacterized protein n=1 Tax=Caerostris extrusa TaxID=172846 RepID=A0AAV4PN36_CAEEX|nr:hypothetical protein CEXT_714631 [Caerostris extrusa]
MRVDLRDATMPFITIPPSQDAMLKKSFQTRNRQGASSTWKRGIVSVSRRSGKGGGLGDAWNNSQGSI